MDESPNRNVFISWSGELSKSVAVVIRKWLPLIVSDADPWMSSEDISKGAAWATEIDSSLSSAKAGIIILTKENLTAPWVLFECGALHKSLSSFPRCTLLCDLPKPVPGPLGQFQATSVEKDDLRDLFLAISRAVDRRDSADRVNTLFNNLWESLRADLDKALSQTRPTKQSKELRVIDVVTEMATNLKVLSARVDGLQKQIQKTVLQQGTWTTNTASKFATDLRPFSVVSVNTSDEVDEFISERSSKSGSEVRKIIMNAAITSYDNDIAAGEIEIDGEFIHYSTNVFHDKVIVNADRVLPF